MFGANTIPGEIVKRKGELKFKQRGLETVLYLNSMKSFDFLHFVVQSDAESESGSVE